MMLELTDLNIVIVADPRGRMDGVLHHEVTEGGVDAVAPRGADDPRAVAVVRIRSGEVWAFDDSVVTRQLGTAICKQSTQNFQTNLRIGFIKT